MLLLRMLRVRLLLVMLRMRLLLGMVRLLRLLRVVRLRLLLRAAVLLLGGVLRLPGLLPQMRLLLRRLLLPTLLLASMLLAHMRLSALLLPHMWLPGLLLAVLLWVVLLLVRVLPWPVLRLGLRVLLRVLLLRLPAVRSLAVAGPLCSPPRVPVQGVLGVPRFGAGAPAIVSHRSPRAARRRWLSGGTASGSPLCCAAAVRTPPHRAERYRIAIR
ncbi:hypothetical protein GA0115259_105413 [Streptomyces sp. MnatMP-M17]|nr:hypothetical protein GA0115259_105413 [Streptomyces sp. MnatMP-M17]